MLLCTTESGFLLRYVAVNDLSLELQLLLRGLHYKRIIH